MSHGVVGLFDPSQSCPGEEGKKMHLFLLLIQEITILSIYPGADFGASSEDFMILSKPTVGPDTRIQ